MTPDDIFAALAQSGIEETPPEFGFQGYRCSAWLKDGTYLPSVLMQRIGAYADRRREMIDEEIHGKGAHQFFSDPLREHVKSDLTWANRVALFHIERIEPCRFAIPMSLLRQVRGETAMSLWLFILETVDGRRFGFQGSTLPTLMFLDLPEDIEFGAFVKVRNVGKGKLPRVERWCRERLFFECFIDDEPPSKADLSSLGLE
ncbi:MAG: hypothetical protein HY054_04670 [Proteobacteria bacterium]|nr:hypothetical protein [Pseudomonadota bacterium]